MSRQVVAVLDSWFHYGANRGEMLKLTLRNTPNLSGEFSVSYHKMTYVTKLGKFQNILYCISIQRLSIV